MFCELWLSQRYLRSGRGGKIISLTALISIIGITIGVLVLIVVIAVMSGFDRYLEDKMVGTNAHLSLDFYSGTKDYHTIMEKLQIMPHVQAVAPFIDGQAFLKVGAQVISIQLRGIDPSLQPQISKIKEYIRKGTIEVQANEVIARGEAAQSVSGQKDIPCLAPVDRPKLFDPRHIFMSGHHPKTLCPSDCRRV